MSLRGHITDATVASIGSKTTYTGATTALVGWLTVNNVVAILGAVIALAGFVVNAYYRRRDHELTRQLALEREAREREIHQLRIARLRAAHREANEDAQ